MTQDASTTNGNGTQREVAMETILKCMRLAADPGATEGERDVAQRKAEQIMARWQIASLELRMKQDGNKPKATSNVKDTTEMFFDPKADWEYRLASGISRTFNSRIMVLTGYGIQFFGHADDLEIIDFFFGKLRMEIDSWAEDAYPKQRDIVDRRSYGMGMTQRVVDRLAEMYKVMEEQMPNGCKDLIVISTALIKQRMNEMYPSQKTIKPKAIRADAYHRGYNDGSNLNLSSNRRAVNQ
jgi:hypothetical protein